MVGVRSTATTMLATIRVEIKAGDDSTGATEASTVVQATRLDSLICDCNEGCDGCASDREHENPMDGSQCLFDGCDEGVDGCARNGELDSSIGD